MNFRISICILVLLCITVGAACAARINLVDPVRITGDELMKSIYMFPHWWDPWKSDDAALTADIQKIKGLGFNTLCLDHEVSQAVDREWYWLDREYKLAGQEKVYILPWLQLQCVDRLGLMQFSHFQLSEAVNQDKQPEADCANFRDPEFRRALAHYVEAYLERYINDPALLNIKDGDKMKPVVGLMVETGWRSTNGLPLSFDDETNAYFRRWMKSSYHDLAQLNKKWGTSYKSFDEIDPCDKAIFNYDFPDKANMPKAVQDHVRFRARMIGEALQEVAKQVRKRHKNVLFAAEIAYPLSSDNPDAAAYKWNDANEYKAVEFADMVYIRTVGNTSTGQVKKEQDLMMQNGKKVILAYRFFGDSTPARAIAFALDCATSANGIGYYNWNETADDASAIYNKPDRQAMAGIMLDTYDLLCNPDKRQVTAAVVVPLEAAAPVAAVEPAPAPLPALEPVAPVIEPAPATTVAPATPAP